MKLTFLGSLILFTAAVVHAQSGGAFEMKSSVVATGGTVASSDDQRFVLNGTIGQIHAAPSLQSADQRFAMEPGFWHGIQVVQTVGAPTLKIRLGSRETLILSWPVAATGFELEETDSLGGRPEWTLTSKEVVDTATEHTVAVPRTGLMKLYRLKKP
jgi:hypothetical protein